MPSTDPRQGLTPEEFRAKVNEDLESFRPDYMGSTGSIRIRSHDEMVPLAQTKQKLQKCRKTQKIGDTVFRCDAGPHAITTDHIEHGLVKQKGHPDIEYYVAWQEVPPRVIRTES